MTTSTILKTYAKVMNARGEISALYKQLGRSLRIEEVWPQAFQEGCRCSAALIGTNYPDGVRIDPSKRYPSPYQRVRDITRTYLCRSDGVEHDITPKELFWIFAEGTDTDRCFNNLLPGDVPWQLPVEEPDI